jgi:GntR family transcriptional regulator / MocR family aminotransferase
LREAIYSYLTISRGVQCQPEQIVVVADTQQALQLVSRALLKPGDPVWVEEPGYFAAQAVFKGAGASMSIARRMELLRWASKSGAWIVEDDYDGEFRYSSRPLPALQSLDRNGNVIYVGSFSKMLFPALRLGYMVVPTGLLARICSRVENGLAMAPDELQNGATTGCNDKAVI